MAIPSTIQETIAMIDERIISLQTIKRGLVREFGNSAQAPTEKKWEKKKTGRRGQLVKFLQVNGPLTRQEIMEKAKLPLGTVAFLLNDKKTFARSEDGKWSALAG